MYEYEYEYECTYEYKYIFTYYTTVLHYYKQCCLKIVSTVHYYFRGK